MEMLVGVSASMAPLMGERLNHFFPFYIWLKILICEGKTLKMNTFTVVT